MPLLLFYGIILPEGLQVSIGSILLMPYRIVLLVMFPVVLMQFGRLRATLTAVDYAIFGVAIYFVVSLCYHAGLAGGLEGGGSYSLDLLMSYLIGRLYLNNAEDFQRFLRKIIIPLAVLAALFVLESVSHEYIIPKIIPFTIKNPQLFRLGLMRAQGTFPQPILAGLMYASLFGVFWGASKPWVKRAGIAVAAMSFFSLSSAGLLTLVISIALAGYAIIMRMSTGKMSWRPLLIMGGLGLVALQLFVSGGVVRAVIRNLSFDPQTGYFRLAIWDWGVLSVSNNPIFGVGYESYQRAAWMVTDSIDNYWLFLAVRFGLPAAVMASFAVLATLYIANQARVRADKATAELLIGLTITLFALWVLLWTVAIWANVLSWFYFLIGTTTGLAVGVMQKKVSAPPLAPRATRRPTDFAGSRPAYPGIPARRG